MTTIVIVILSLGWAALGFWAWLAKPRDRFITEDWVMLLPSVCLGLLAFIIAALATPTRDPSADYRARHAEADAAEERARRIR